MFFWNSLVFSMIQQMLALWSLVPLPFLNPVVISGSSQFIYCWHSLKDFEHYLASMWNECSGSWNILWHCSLRLKWKLTFSSPVATAEFFKFVGYIECNTSTASSFRSLSSSAGIPSLPLALFAVILPKAYLTSHPRISCSRWVIIALWLSGSLRPICAVLATSS